MAKTGKSLVPYSKGRAFMNKAKSLVKKEDTQKLLNLEKVEILEINLL